MQIDRTKLKICLVFCFTTAIMCVLAGEGNFTEALKTCTPFYGTGTVNIMNTAVQSNKKISGWDGDKCVYRESVNFMNIESDIVGRFTQSQINEIASVVDMYEQQNAGSMPDFSSLDTAQDNPVTKVWNKYMQDPSVCSITTNMPQGVVYQ